MLLLALLAALQTDTRTVHRELAWNPGTVIKVSNQYGNLTVQGWTDDRAVFDAVIRATAQDASVASRLSRAVQLLVSRQAETLCIQTVSPSETPEDCGYEVHLRLGVPDEARLVAANSFGDVELAGIQGGCLVTNRFGDVTMHGCRDCDVTSRYGNVQVNEQSGTLAVRNSYGNVLLDGVDAQATVDNRFGDVNAQGLAGIIALNNELGRVMARAAAGQLSVENHYGDVTAWVEDSGLSNLDVVSELGRVELFLEQMLPFRLGARTVHGKVQSELPLLVKTYGQTASGSQGEGGTRINLEGDGADIVIQQQNKE